MSSQNSRLKKKKLIFQENDTTTRYKRKTNLIIFFITLGAIVATIAPFLHIPFDKASTTKIFGFKNARVFFYSLGMPVTILLSALIMSYSSNFISIKLIRKVIQNVSIVFLSIALYYLIWTFTAYSSKDWNPLLYYFTCLIASFFIGSLINKYLKFIGTIPRKYVNVRNNIPALDKKIKTVNDIAKIMPSNDNTITYKAMVDVTGDKLNYIVSEIKKELNDEKK